MCWTYLLTAVFCHLHPTRAVDARLNRTSCPLRAVYLSARMSIFSIRSSLAFANSSEAFAMSALAISPCKCASRPVSSSKVSKTPYIPGAILTPYQFIVMGSSWLIVAPCFRKASTAASLPGFAFNITQIAFVAIAKLLRILEVSFPVRKISLTLLVLCQLQHGPVQVLRLGQNRVLQHRLIGAECIHRCHPPNRSIQPVEQLFTDAGGDLCAIAPAQRVFMRDDHLAGLLHRLRNCIPVIRAQRTEVDQLHIHACLALQFLRRL